MDKYAEVDLMKEQNVLVITSTYGDGDPPDMAQGFWEWLKAGSAPKLDHLIPENDAAGITDYLKDGAIGVERIIHAVGVRRL